MVSVLNICVGFPPSSSNQRMDPGEKRNTRGWVEKLVQTGEWKRYWGGGGGATEGDKNTLYACLKFSSNKNVEPEPHVAIRVYNPALRRLREENF